MSQEGAELDLIAPGLVARRVGTPWQGTPFGGVGGTDLGEALRDPARSLDVFLHFRILGLLGMPIGEMWDLEALGEDCASDGVYEFLLTSAPLNLLNGVGSPANALAVK